MSGFRIEGNTSGNIAEVAGTNQLKVIQETDTINNLGNVGGTRIFQENDGGYILGTPVLTSIETDNDYRGRVSLDTLLDEEVFNYTAQNTGKHQAVVTTMAANWTAGQFTTNSGSITTTTTGYYLQTYANFPNVGTNTLSGDFQVAFSAQPSVNNFVEFGFSPIISSATAAPADGIFFRLNASGMQGIVSFNGTETSTGVFTGPNNTGTWGYTNSKRHQFIVYASAVEANFWINDGTNIMLMGRVVLPAGHGRINLGAGLKMFFGQRITGGAAGAVLQANLNAYNVRIGGTQLCTQSAQLGNRLYGSYQGLSGGTMGSLANYANSANPTAAVPTNTTAALGTGLGGQFWETATLAVNTDGILCSFQVPAASANGSNRRLVINGVYISSYIQTVIAGGPYNAQISLAFGHTAVSLATGEATATKAPRRIPICTQLVTAAQAVNTLVTQSTNGISFRNPIYVNPGEFVAVVTKHVGTVGTSGTVAHMITFDYGWE